MNVETQKKINQLGNILRSAGLKHHSFILIYSVKTSDRIFITQVQINPVRINTWLDSFEQTIANVNEALITFDPEQINYTGRYMNENWVEEGDLLMGMLWCTYSSLSLPKLILSEAKKKYGF